MQKVYLRFLLHRNQECIGIYFENSVSINKAIKKDAGARWSESNKCWHIPLAKENYNKLFFALQGKAEIEQADLHKYLSDKKKKEPAANKTPKINYPLPANRLPPAIKKETGMARPGLVKQQILIYKNQKIHPTNSHVLPAMLQQLILKAYSRSTVKTYINEMSQLLQIINNIPADDLTPEHLKRYLVYCYEILKLSENTLHSRINAMKFYYEQVLKKEKFFWDIPRPKKPLLLPKVLSENELARLFNALTNKKHKAMLFTAYSAGLRVSEIVNLKIADIDSRRMQIFLQRAKGKKDRYVNLSPILLDILRTYIRDYKPRPTVYLFESEQSLAAYPSRTVQTIFSNAKNKAGIKKEVGIHSLRHSFATHLLEKGTDIKYIKDILGHFNIKTTERYLHVSKKKLVNIISPFDDLWKNGEVEW